MEFVTSERFTIVSSISKNSALLELPYTSIELFDVTFMRGRWRWFVRRKATKEIMMASTLSTTLIASKMFKPCSGFAKKVGSLPKKSGGKMSKHHESLAEFLWEVGDAGGYLVIPLGTGFVAWITTGF
jgi:hypothetical protein